MLLFHRLEPYFIIKHTENINLFSIVSTSIAHSTRIKKLQHKNTNYITLAHPINLSFWSWQSMMLALWATCLLSIVLIPKKYVCSHLLAARLPPSSQDNSKKIKESFKTDGAPWRLRFFSLMTRFESSSRLIPLNRQWRQSLKLRPKRYMFWNMT